MNRIIIFTLSLILSLSAFAITVKIENTSLDLNTKDPYSNDAIKVKSTLTVSGIKGKDFDLVAIVKDDTGNWHKDYNGKTVKTYKPLNATYESSLWEGISVYLPHSKLAPKKGKHTYKVYLYVYYNGEFYNGTYVGSYDQTGYGNSSSSHSHNHSHSSNSSTTKTCTTCNGVGHRTCGGCAGKGGVQFPQYSYYPFYSVNYVWIPCTVCGGAGQLKCYTCNGTGSITTNTNNNTNNSNNSYNNYNNYSGGSTYTPNYNNNYNSNSSSSSSSTYTTCSTCGGSGVCTSCHGTGGSWQDTGYYTGSGTKSWINCPSCNGSKKCFMCYGRGKY